MTIQSFIHGYHIDNLPLKANMSEKGRKIEMVNTSIFSSNVYVGSGIMCGGTR